MSSTHSLAKLIFRIVPNLISAAWRVNQFPGSEHPSPKLSELCTTSNLTFHSAGLTIFTTYRISLSQSDLLNILERKPCYINLETAIPAYPSGASTLSNLPPQNPTNPHHGLRREPSQAGSASSFSPSSYSY